MHAVVSFVKVDAVGSNTTLSESMKAVVGGKEDAVKTCGLHHSSEALNLVHFGGREM